MEFPFPISWNSWGLFTESRPGAICPFAPFPSGLVETAVRLFKVERVWLVLNFVLFIFLTSSSWCYLNNFGGGKMDEKVSFFSRIIFIINQRIFEENLVNLIMVKLREELTFSSEKID